MQRLTPKFLRPLLALWLVGALAPVAAAFEDTDMLPAGVRNINLRTVSSNFDEKTNDGGVKQPLGEPLNQALTFNKIAEAQSPLKATELKAFLAANGYSGTDSVGSYNADLKGHLSVVAPIISYGITDHLNLGVAVPVYSASTSVSVGFQPNANAQAFLNKLTDPHNNQTAAARDAASQLNTAVARLNVKAKENGYRELTDWQGEGLGDTTLATKYLAIQQTHVRLAATTGIIAPTGRTDDPDNLTDVPFGNGVWAPFEELCFDEPLGLGFILNQYGKYTNQLPGRKTVRAITTAEPLEVPDESTRFKLGDMFDAGAALRYEPSFGLMTGVGANFHHKYGDLYKGVAGDTKFALQQGSEQKATNAEFLLGYSTVPLYFQHAVSVPLDLRLTYSKQLTSRNMPVSDLLQADFNLYF